MNRSELARHLENHGQGHLARHMRNLDGPDRTRLERELSALDLAHVSELGRLIGKPAFGGDRKLEPTEIFPLARDAAQLEQAEAARRRGADVLRAGRVGFVLVAGGQASRLGYDGPKGCFPIGPLSKRSLFGFHAARIRAASRRLGFTPAWYVMTSPANDAATKEFFTRHHNFGLAKKDIVFFTQEMLPALDEQGRILLSGPGEVFLAPNGHGGTLDGLARSGALAHARARGISHLSYFQVDNPLAPPADPLFIGLHVLAGAQMSSKVVEKRDPSEKVGVLGRIDGRVGCIEYSDLPKHLLEARDAAGRLQFRAGNIAMHCIDVDFVASLTDGGLKLPWHLAQKRMKVFEPGQGEVERVGVKFETFVFDALAACERTVTLEVDRALEFSPVKNRDGVDSPQTCATDLRRLHGGWLAELGRVPAFGTGTPPLVEVDPLVAESVDELRRAPAASFREVGGGLLVSNDGGVA
jgi:UDP-N-acetylglucosamine/UDP-N-acetylgalactosamine diphosphorylase